MKKDPANKAPTSEQEPYYEEALNEMNRSEERRPGIYAKAFADSLGDEKKIDSLYLEYLVQSLMEKAERIEAKRIKAKRIELERIAEEERIAEVERIAEEERNEAERIAREKRIDLERSEELERIEMVEEERIEEERIVEVRRREKKFKYKLGFITIFIAILWIYNFNSF